MIGIDLVNIPEFTQQMTNGGTTFAEKAFTAVELRNDDMTHLAGLWAAKEAVMKASGTEAGRWLSIEIEHTQSGAPIAHIDDMTFEISISHHGDYAVAVAYA
jgi:phosphopantetheine--protein transferase-like protein